jgi:hypothetical protein
MNEERQGCSFCHSKETEYWHGKSESNHEGLSGLRCPNGCLASYVIFTETLILAGFPKETEEEYRKEMLRHGKIHKKH